MPGLQRREIPGVRGTVTNTGARAGTETVQRYVHHVDQPVFRPDQELRAFARVTLDPGQSTTVRLTLGTRAFAYWHDQQHRWHVAPGSYDLRIGASSRDHRLVASITLEGKPLAAPLTSETDAETWLAHPDAGPWLTGVFTGQDLGTVLLDPDEGRMLRAIPLIRLARTPGTGLDEPMVDEAVTRFER